MHAEVKRSPRMVSFSVLCPCLSEWFRSLSAEETHQQKPCTYRTNAFSSQKQAHKQVTCCHMHSRLISSLPVVQVCTCYPQQTAGFAQEVMDLLDKHYAILSSSLRQSLVKSLILLRNRGHLKSAEVLPLFFRLFRCQDKSLRDLLFKHIVAGLPSLYLYYTQLVTMAAVTQCIAAHDAAQKKLKGRTLGAKSKTHLMLRLCIRMQCKGYDCVGWADTAQQGDGSQAQ